MTNPIEQAEEEYSQRECEEYSLEEFLEYARENPNAVANSVQYLVNAIEYFGTRTVIEYGEEKTRYRFFDDPVNDGEHAVLGNTDALNSFVDSLRRKASEDGENNKIIWFTGPTATGKSELKRCLLNGLQAYAKTDEGRRYTVKWSLDSLSSFGMTYNDGFVDEKDWYKSPVHTNPLSVLPNGVRESFAEEVNRDEYVDIDTDAELDPFSKVAYGYLEKEYDCFSDIVSEEHLKVVSYVPEIGEGFGVLQSEDVGDAKQKIVGSWMRDAMEQYSERGKKNAQAFTYDGLLSQGNSSVSVVEDAQHHASVFSKLMNVCEENVVKLDNKITMHIDSVIICISNPDFQSALNEHQEAGERDPNKALRRRLEKYNFNYLTSVVLETQLLLKHLTSGDILWEDEDVEILLEKASQSIELFGTHFAPHAIETAAYFEVLTRVEEGTMGKKKKVSYYDKGYVGDNRDEKYEEDALSPQFDGLSGIPVTYTENILCEIAQEKDGGVVMPYDIIDVMVENLNNDPVFSDSEVSEFGMDVPMVEDYAIDQMEKDVLDAIVGEDDIKKDEIHDYVDSLFSWEEGDEDGFDPFEIMEFEKKYFKTSENDYFDDASPKEMLINTFRKDKIISHINTYIYENRDEYEPDQIPIEECPTLRRLIEDESWERVDDLYPNLDYSLWRNPPEGSETEEVKQKTIKNMKEKGYNQKSAEKATAYIVSKMEVPYAS